MSKPVSKPSSKPVPPPPTDREVLDAVHGHVRSILALMGGGTGSEEEDPLVAIVGLLQKVVEGQERMESRLAGVEYALLQSGVLLGARRA